MEKAQTWRELLGKATSETLERQRIAEALGVNQTTLTRWATGKSSPRLDNLRSLLDVLPHYRQQLSALMAIEFPDFRVTESTTSQEEATPLEIPSAFYARVLNAHTTIPPILRTSSICILILQQIVAQLDPDKRGIAVSVVQCVPPAPGEREIRSLRTTLGRGTPPWKSHMENQTQFFGAESLTGQALTLGRYIALHNQAARSRLFPALQSTLEASAIAYPILQAERTPGCLYIASTQPNMFSLERLDLIQSYADLMTLAFEPKDFYHMSNIELGIMPSETIQQPFLATFRQRVTRHLLQTQQENQPLTRPQAEFKVWKELERELLHLPPR